MSFAPSVCKGGDGTWIDADESIDIDCFDMVSVGAYIDDSSYDNTNILKKSKCDLLLLLEPNERKKLWTMRIMVSPVSELAEKAAKLLAEQLINKQSNIQLEFI